MVQNCGKPICVKSKDFKLYTRVMINSCHHLTAIQRGRVKLGLYLTQVRVGAPTLMQSIHSHLVSLFFNTAQAVCAALHSNSLLFCQGFFSPFYNILQVRKCTPTCPFREYCSNLSIKYKCLHCWKGCMGH